MLAKSELFPLRFLGFGFFGDGCFSSTSPLHLCSARSTA